MNIFRFDIDELLKKVKRIIKKKKDFETVDIVIKNNKIVVTYQYTPSIDIDPSQLKERLFLTKTHYMKKYISVRNHFDTGVRGFIHRLSTDLNIVDVSSNIYLDRKEKDTGDIIRYTDFMSKVLVSADNVSEYKDTDTLGKVFICIEIKLQKF